MKISILIDTWEFDLVNQCEPGKSVDIKFEVETEFNHDVKLYIKDKEYIIGQDEFKNIILFVQKIKRK